jgi:hypothetical protein
MLEPTSHQFSSNDNIVVPEAYATIAVTLCEYADQTYYFNTNALPCAGGLVSEKILSDFRNIVQSQPVPRRSAAPKKSPAETLARVFKALSHELTAENTPPAMAHLRPIYKTLKCSSPRLLGILEPLISAGIIHNPQTATIEPPSSSNVQHVLTVPYVHEALQSLKATSPAAEDAVRSWLTTNNVVDDIQEYMPSNST